jgi:hypothetical protein
MYLKNVNIIKNLNNILQILNYHKQDKKNKLF